MNDQKSREVVYFKIPVFLFDAGIHIFTLCCLLKWLPKEQLRGLNNIGLDVGLLSLLVVSLIVSLSFIGIRLHERRIKLNVVIWRAILQTLFTYMLFTITVALVYKLVPRHLIIYAFCLSLPVITILHVIANKLVRFIRHIGRNTRHVLYIGADENIKRLYAEMGYGQSFTGYKVQGYFSSLAEELMPEEVPYLGKVSDFYEWIKENHPDEIYCSLPPATCQNDVNSIIRICNEQFVEFYFVPTMDGYPHRQMAFRQFGGVSLIRLREEPMNNVWMKAVKRLIDISVSGLFLCTLYPLVLIFVWIGNKLTGNIGPLYFRQARTGYNGKSFWIYKFRSMKVNKDADKIQATKDDPRKTPFGDFLRRSSIDELPQFINVFLGDMSIIGPRPHMEYHTEVYSNLIADYMVRHLAKPGITGWAQINGCRGETKTTEEMANRVKHDIWYIEHWSLWLDFVIFFRTIWQVIPGHDKQAY